MSFSTVAHNLTKQTELELCRLSLRADRQPLQTRHSVSFAGSCSRQCSRIHACTVSHTDGQNKYNSVERLNKKKVVLTTKLLLTFSKMRFSFSAIASPFLFFTRFFSSFLQAYILPVARTWQAQTWKTSSEKNVITLTCALKMKHTPKI